MTRAEELRRIAEITAAHPIPPDKTYPVDQEAEEQRNVDAWRTKSLHVEQPVQEATTDADISKQWDDWFSLKMTERMPDWFDQFLEAHADNGFIKAFDTKLKDLSAENTKLWAENASLWRAIASMETRIAEMLKREMDASARTHSGVGLSTMQ